MTEPEHIYCDYASSTPVAMDVLNDMRQWMEEDFANPSSTHAAGQQARIAIDDARRTVSEVLGCAWNEVVFMSSGTESANAAILGTAREKRRETGAAVHVVTTNIEHHAVLDACKQLEREGDRVTYVPVGADGIVRVDDIVAALTPETVLVTVMLANNEIGTIQPVAEIAQAVKAAQPDVLVHTDACQAGNTLSLNVVELHVDMLTVNGSKIYGPKGSAIVYKRSGVVLQPLTFGGGQEFGLRPGTENVAAIVGFARALQSAQKQRLDESVRLTALRDQFIEGVMQAIPGVQLNGAREPRLPNNANLYFPHIDGDIFLFQLSQAGIAASLGSACTAGSIDPSHVLLALGRSAQEAKQCVRFSFGRQTTSQHIEELIARISLVYQQVV